MKYENLLEVIGAQSFFDLATLVQLTNDSRHNILSQLHRWCSTGKLVPLRRGMYAVSKKYGRKEVRLPEVANAMYIPSYLSSVWALGYFGLIPEKVVVYTSITGRKTRIFENSLGVFQYQHVKQEAFFGYQAMEIEGVKIMIAEPEKSMLDVWYLDSGLWDKPRMEEMRFQNIELIDQQKLMSYSARFNSPRILTAVKTWLAVYKEI